VQTGFSCSERLLVEVTEAPLMLFLGPAPRAVSIATLDIVGSSSPAIPNPGLLLAYIDVGSEDAATNEGGLSDAGLAERVELAAEDGAEEEDVEDSEEKTDPSTRFAFSREASFLNSMRRRDTFLGSGGGGRGLRSKGMKPAGRRVMCIECGRRCRGRQGGSGSLAGCDLSRRLVGV